MGASAIAGALLSNDSLTELDISWNKIRNRGSEVLGKMLASNTGLISLNVSFNGLDALVSYTCIASTFLNNITACGVSNNLVGLKLTSSLFSGSSSFCEGNQNKQSAG